MGTEPENGLNNGLQFNMDIPPPLPKTSFYFLQIPNLEKDVVRSPERHQEQTWFTVSSSVMKQVI